MLSKTSQKMTEYFLRRGIITEDSREIYAYGFELILSTTLNFALTVVLAILYGRPLDAPIYLVSTFPLRTFGGGWHAGTHFLCSLMHACAFTAVSWLSFWSYTYMSLWAVIAVVFIAFVIILARAPSEHPDNPLTEDARVKSRRHCIVYALILCAGIVVAGALGYAHTATLVSVGAFSAAATMLFKNKSSD